MKSKPALFAIYMATLSLTAAPIHAQEVLFEDSFESGDMSATNTEGFSWAQPNRTSIVFHDEEDGPVAIYNGTEIYNIHDAIMPDGTVRDWHAFDGNNSLRFRYPAGENWAEQRFELGTPLRDVWIGFWLRVPTNYKHPIVSKSNNKLFAIWMDGYSTAGDGPTVVWGPWSDGAEGSTVAGGWSEGGNTVTGSQIPPAPFITYPDDQGRWMHLIFHLQAATNETSNDGVIQMYRKWDGDSSYSQIHNITNANIPSPPGGPNGWASGYILGWANATYEEDTEWLVDNFVISKTSLIDTPPPMTIAPNPPNMFSVQ